MEKYLEAKDLITEEYQEEIFEQLLTVIEEFDHKLITSADIYDEVLANGLVGKEEDFTQEELDLIYDGAMQELGFYGQCVYTSQEAIEFIVAEITYDLSIDALMEVK